MPHAPTNLYLHPPRLPLIAPSILSADFTEMGNDCRQVLSPSTGGGGGADVLHLDVMDGHFVPNLTMGPDMCRAVRRACPGAFLDVHLMVTDPALFIDPFADAGADHLTFHVEAVAGSEIADLAARIRGHGLTAGLAINPPTPVELVLPWVGGRHGLDLVLVMSVNPGFSGQRFIDPVLEKTRLVAQHARASAANCRVQMDGGINLETAPGVRAAGCDVIVAASAIFGVPRERRGEVIADLRGDR
jgi:ribulose-phosphate 3-epimerase